MRHSLALAVAALACTPALVGGPAQASEPAPATPATTHGMTTPGTTTPGTTTPGTTTPGTTTPGTTTPGTTTPGTTTTETTTPGTTTTPTTPTAALPWGKRRASIGLGAGVNIPSSLTVVAPGVRAGYFVADGLELGGEVEVAVLLWSAADLTAHPGLARDAPGLAVRVTPTIRYVFLRQPGFSPYLLAGAGPTIWAHAGVVGHWIAAPGALIHLGRRVYLDLAIRFSSSFPGRACRSAFTIASGEAPGYCGFQFGPRVGLAMAF